MRYLFALILLFTSLPICAQDGLEGYQWDVVPGAVSYRGTVQNSSEGPYQFSTPYHKVLLPLDSRGMVVEARDADGRVIKFASVKKVQRQAKATTKSPKDDVYDNANLDAEPDVALDDKRFFDGFVPIQYTAKSKRTSDSRIEVSLGFGAETLKVSGGISSFDSTSTVGGTRLSYEWNRVRKNKRKYGAKLSGEAHVHNAKIKETDDTTSQTSYSEYHFFRSRISAMGQYSLDQFFRANHQITLGLGLGSIRLPIMAITDDSTGQSKPNMKTAYGPMTDLGYRFVFFGTQEVGVQASYLAMGLGEIKKINSLEIDMHYGYFVDESKGLLLSYTMLQESAKKDLSCPAVTLCKDSASTTASSSHLNLGFVIIF